jgi:hypothetical protein
VSKGDVSPSMVAVELKETVIDRPDLDANLNLSHI